MLTNSVPPSSFFRAGKLGGEGEKKAKKDSQSTIHHYCAAAGGGSRDICKKNAKVGKNGDS